ncbi:uncharacterized protein Dvar_13460 [Desulfosarcina variabilis str. Montpellier]
MAVGATPKTGARTSNFDQFIKFPILIFFRNIRDPVGELTVHCYRSPQKKVIRDVQKATVIVVRC